MSPMMFKSWKLRQQMIHNKASYLQLQVSNSIYVCSNRNHNFRGQIHGDTTCAEGLLQNYMKKSTNRVERARNWSCINFRNSINFGNSKCPCIPVKIDSASAFTRYFIQRNMPYTSHKRSQLQQNHSSSQSKILKVINRKGVMKLLRIQLY